MWGKFYFSSSSVVSRAFSGHVHAMRILDVWASSSSPRLSLRQILFLSRPHCCASLQRKIRYLITHSLSHSPSLFDMPGTEAYHFWITIKTVYYGTRKDGLTTSKFNWSTANISSSNPTISNLLNVDREKMLLLQIIHKTDSLLKHRGQLRQEDSWKQSMDWKHTYIFDKQSMQHHIGQTVVL